MGQTRVKSPSTHCYSQGDVKTYDIRSTVKANAKAGITNTVSNRDIFGSKWRTPELEKEEQTKAYVSRRKER